MTQVGARDIQITMHPIYAAALRYFCDQAGLQVTRVEAWIRGDGAPPLELATLFERELGVPIDSWAASPKSAANYIGTFRTRKPGKPVNPLEEAGRLGGKARAAKLAGRTSVHAGLKELGWTLGEFAAALSAHLGRKIAKSSVAFWALGERPAGTKGSYYRLTVSAPTDVKAAADEISGGIIRPEHWP